jgi:hypothetical protein
MYRILFENKRLIPIVVLFLAFFASNAIVFADGTETLDDPSIPIASGTDIIAAGVGMNQQPSSLEITIPTGAVVNQVILYWEGQMYGEVTGDNTININGQNVTGTLIGGPAYFFGNVYSSAYRADITSLSLLDTGTNNLVLSELNFSYATNGAGVMVIYDDGSGTADIQIRDGLDLAFIYFPEPRKSTVPQTFNFPPSAEERTGNLAMFFSSVAGSISGAGADRPTSIEVTIGGTTTFYSNLLASISGEEWDTLNLPITIPANATDLTIQAFSRDDNATGNLPASFTWIGTGLSVPVIEQPATVGDRVWFDNNGDGVQDADEDGIPGVTVDLTDCTGNVLATDTTDANGNYLFADVDAGTYCIVVDETTLPGNVAQTFEKDGSLDGDTEQPLAPGDDIRDVDFGYQPLGAIGDTVFEDTNGNGIQDAGEPGISGVTVDLTCAGADGTFGTADDIIASAITDGSGNYLFEDLPAGACEVNPDETTVPAGYELTTNNDPQTVDLGPGETFLDADFGYQPPRLVLGDRVWYDQDQDGIQDANEPGYNGATVDLFDNATCSGSPIASTMTMAGPAGFGDGYYLFGDLLAGDYCVQFGNIPAGWSISPADQGNGTNDSSANGSAQIPNISLTGNDLDEDMGIFVTGSLGDSVVCLPTSEGLANITVTLFEDFDGDGVADGPAIATTETDATGFYQFTGLEVALAGDVGNTTNYIVQVDVNDADLGVCNVPDGPTEYNPPLDSDNPDDPNNDFTFTEPPATVGDRVWFDNNGDGVQDADEDGIPGVTVDLTDCTGNVLATDTTDANGDYLFADVDAGTYCIVVDETTLPGNVAQTFEKDGSLDGDTEQPLAPGDDIRDVDFGYQPLGAIGDTVFEDTNGNGIQDAGEPGISGVTVTLNDPGTDGVCGTADDLFIASDVTDTNGNYLFTDLPQGTYCVDPDETTVPADYTLTTNNDPQTVDLGPGETFLDADFGYQPPRLVLGDRVWYDQDQDGIQDANEPGYNGATVDLFDNATCSGSPIASTMTMAGPAGFGDGYYLFGDLLAGDYCVQFGNIPAGWSISPADQGDGTNDSSANGSAQIPNISLTDNDPNEDMGIYVAGSLGDSVVCASTGDGLASITVTLFADFDGDGVADGPAIATTETDATGFYQFTGLEVALAGDVGNTTNYIVQVDVNDADLGVCNVPDGPTEYNPPLDSDNPDDPNNDFTFTEPPATVGDRVWFDNNGDGVQDADEDGIPGVTVDLTDCTGNVLATDTTDANGDYLFADVDAGTYCIVVDETTLPGNVAQTFEKDGSLDGDTEQPLAPGDDIRDVDFGYIPVAIAIEKYTRIEVSQSGADLCENYGKPQLLTMLYTGDNVNDNSQDASKVSIAGDPLFTSPVRIVASQDAYGGGNVYFDGEVLVGDSFLIDATLSGNSELRSETWVTIYDLNGNLLQLINFHTSCSQPLLLGDQFGGIQLLGFQDKDGGGESLPQTTGFGDDADTPTGPTAVVGDTIIWTYIVTNAGNAPLSDIMVTDDAGTPGDGSDDFSAVPVTEGSFNVGDINNNDLLDAGEEWQYTAGGTALLGQYGNLGTVNGSAFGLTVSDVDPSHYFGEYTGADLCENYGKPQLLTMLYTGDNVNDNSQDASKVSITGDPLFTSPVRIVASEKEFGDGKVYFDGVVDVGETFLIDARTAGDSELRSETWVTIYDLNGSVLQSINFHTSCSQPLALGDQFGGIQLVGFQDKNGGGEGEIPPGAEVRADLCENYGKPQLLTMVYTGDNVNDNSQDASKVSITGDPLFTSPVRIVASEKEFGDGKVYFDGVVDVGETFLIDARTAGDSELRSETWVTIYDLNGSVLQSINFHTSCSQPLALGDQFGGIQLVGFQDKNGGGEGEIPPGAEVRADLCENYEKPQLLTMVYTGDNVNDNSQDASKVSITGDPLFTSPVRIVASEKEFGDGKVYFDGVVDVGETFLIDARTAGDSELRSETWVTIYNLNGSVLQSINFHTSCSQPLALGDQFGGIQLFAFADKNGAGESQ